MSVATASERSRDVAAKLLAVLIENPMTANELIDALAMACNAALAMKREAPDLWRRATLDAKP